MELESSIVNSIHAYLIAHLVDFHSIEGFEVGVSDGNQEGVNSLIFSLDYGLSEHKGLICMDGSIGDPILLGKGCRTINDEFLSFIIIG